MKPEKKKKKKKPAECEVEETDQRKQLGMQNFL